MNGLVIDDNIAEDPEGLILLIESTNPDPRIRFNTQIIVIQINSDDSKSLLRIINFIINTCRPCSLF